MQEKLKKAITEALGKVGISTEPQKISLEHPSEIKNGDYASGVALAFAKQSGKNPRALAEEIVAALSTVDGVAKIEIAGPGFINFYLASNEIASAINDATSEESWGSFRNLKDKKIMVEYTDPNPFKEFHIGHLMSNAIGESIARLLQFSGAEVKRANYQGDVGPHVAKALWGKMQRLEMTWGEAYAMGAAAYEANKDEIDEINKKVYEKSDPKINALYDAGRKESLEHFEELYKILGTKFDFYFFESESAGKGLEIVKAHPNVFEISDGATVYKGEKVGLHTRVFITSKGLPTYETKELGLVELKTEKATVDESITITAHEQTDYFKVVLAAMKEVMPEIAQKIRHVSHGMMRLPSGKMSSRTGDVITGESLLDDLIEAAKERAKESRAENHDQLAQEVAVAAVKYQILKQASGKDIIFDKERALSLEGDSGPYLQYAHARTSAVVEKAASQNVMPHYDDRAPISDLARFLHRFPEIVARASREREPHHVTTYLLEVASMFNSWYAQEQILDASTAQAHKVALTSAVNHTLKNGLWILGIPAPQKM
jgi:arginyl-tRNA synthetase